MDFYSDEYFDLDDYMDEYEKSLNDEFDQDYEYDDSKEYEEGLFVYRQNAKEFRKKRWERIKLKRALLESIPQQGGVFILTFPNGKHFMGFTLRDMRERIKYNLKFLTQSKKTKYHRFKPRYVWHEQCFKENPNIESFEEIQIRIALHPEPYKYYKELWNSLTPEEKENFYYSKAGRKTNKERMEIYGEDYDIFSQ